MERFVLAAVFGSTRRLLAVVVAGLAIAGAGYLISHKLSNPDHYRYGHCPVPDTIVHGPIRVSPCRPPAMAVWQIPLALVIAVGGLGAAAVLIGARPRRRAPVPELGTLPPA
jgi:hypothetical protein